MGLELYCSINIYKLNISLFIYKGEKMSRIDNVVFINSGFNHGKSDIEDAFRTHDSVLLQAQSEAI